jgi:hypothetical protein
MASALAALSIVLVLVACTNTTTAATYTTVGVSPGSSSVYSETWSASLATTENKMVITIHSVVGTVVYENVTYYLADGTFSRKLNLAVDVSANNYISMESIIASGLTTDDPTYPSAAYKINDSSTMTFAGAARTINHFKQSVFNAADWYLEDWWDKDTGITVKFNLYWPYSGGFWQNITMTSTTAWSPSAPAQSAFSTTSIIAIAGVGIVALGIGFIVGRSGKRKK